MRPTLFARILWMFLAAAIVFARGAASEESSTGLLQTVTSGGITDRSIAPNVWLFVPAGQPATPFVPSGPFTAQWEGSLMADLRGDFTFHAAVKGGVKVSVNGTVTLEAKDTGDSVVAGQSVRLNKGTNSFKVEFASPTTGDASLRLYWTNRETPLNPIPLPQLSPANHESLAASQQLHRGRDLLTELRCVRCHTASGVMPELAMDAPTFDGIGARRNADWMARWIQDPHALRPGTPMPSLFRGPEAKAQADAVAAYLATLKGTETFAAVPGDAAAGKAIFEKLHCIACHVPPEGGDAKPHQISQKEVKAKFTPGALVAFLRQPEKHFAWIRMPNFKLSAEEAGNLAAYLESVAATADPKPISADAALVEKGRKLVATVGCLNCHSLEGVKNEFSTKALAELKSSLWKSGCVAESPEESKGPRYILTSTQRGDLLAFAGSDRASLGRATAADFLERQSKHLNCRECHGQFEGFPAWDHLYGKLKPEWAAQFISGKENWKPRPWLESRMPAFPAYAKGLAEGLSTLAGHAPVSVADPAPDNTTDLAQSGRKLAGASGGFSCISCHSIGEFGATQVFEAPGINLAHSYARLQPDYFRRWLRAPTMIDASSKMPVYFDEEGKSPLTEVLGGDGPKTIQAVWEYLRQGDKMAKPE